MTEQEKPQQVDYLAAVKRAALEMGERTRVAVVMELTHNGQLRYSYSGTLDQIVFMRYLLGREIDKMMNGAQVPPKA